MLFTVDAAGVIAISSFTVRCLFRWRGAAQQAGAYLYEESITLWRAKNIDDALELAESEADTYATVNDCDFLGFSQAYALLESVPTTGIEVFSLLRKSALDCRQYIDAFFHTGTERTND